MIGISKYNIVSYINNDTIAIFNTISGVIITLPLIFYETILDTNVNVLQELNPDMFNFLSKYKIIADDDIECDKLISDILNMHSNLHTLSLLLHSTLKCNLNCSYCFQRGIEQSIMTPQVAMKIVRFIESKCLNDRIDTINITWSGGEPLLNIFPIEYIYNELIKRLPGNIKLNVSLYTNGTLLNRNNVHRLYYAGIRHIQITIDGTDDVHFARRGGSFKSILKNIDNILNEYNDVKISVRTNIDRSNIRDYVKLHMTLTDRYRNRNFTLYPEFVIGDSESNSDLILPDEQCETIMSLARQGAYDVDLLFNRHCQLCMKKSNNSIAICPDGYVYDCEMLVGDKERIIGELDQYIESSLPYKAFNIRDKCKHCNLLPICNFGCIAKTKTLPLCNIMKGSESKFVELYYLQHSNAIAKNVIP